MKIEDMLNNEVLKDELLFVISLHEETQQQRTFKYGYLEYIQEKYMLTDRELQQCYTLVRIDNDLYNLHLDKNPYKLKVGEITDLIDRMKK